MCSKSSMALVVSPLVGLRDYIFFTHFFYLFIIFFIFFISSKIFNIANTIYKQYIKGCFCFNLKNKGMSDVKMTFMLNKTRLTLVTIH